MSAAWFDVTGWFDRTEEHLRAAREAPPTARDEIELLVVELRGTATSMRAYAVDSRLRADEADVSAAERDALADELQAVLDREVTR